jgi:glycosyltransferase involved in cell wall biosynthesis
LVSVIIPAYNAERFVERALDSALRQTYTNLEIVVVDDGSQDRTAELIHGRRDPRIRYLHQSNQGQGPARNNGILESTGTYITFLDADDFYRPNKIERQVAHLEAHPEFGATFCNALHFFSDAPDRLLGRSAGVPQGDIFRALLRSSLVNPNTLMIRAGILRGRLAFCEDRYYPEEWDLCLRLSRAGIGFGYQDEDLVVVEIRENSNTTMEIQWVLKRNALRMFEGLFAGMSEGERAALDAGGVLRRCKINLAASYLLVGNKTDFEGLVSEILSGPAAWALRTVVRAMPSSTLRRVVNRAWRWRQVQAFSRRLSGAGGNGLSGGRTADA